MRQIYRFIAREAPAAAAEWMEGVEAAIDSLEEMPARCPVAPEPRFAKRGIRQLLYGRYRILFRLEGRYVRVLTILHTARGPLS